jgi:hypothetical protein
MVAVGAVGDGPDGGVTMTTNDAGVAAFPAASCALHVTVVDPTGNVAPDAGGTVIASGTWMTGGVVSTVGCTS